MIKNRSLFVLNYLVTPERRIDQAALLCEKGNILAVGGLSAFTREPGMSVVYLPNAYATPGFVDTHIHGAGGFDCSSALESARSIDDMGQLLASRGVTAFFPTVVADTPERMIANLAELARLIGEPRAGAVPVGINIEGPFLNPAKRGAQKEDAICPVDLGFAREMLAAAPGLVRLMTFAPELKHAKELVEFLCENNVIPSMGHSIADEKETLRAIDAGASHCTHLFNGMPPLHQRGMNLASISLTDNRVTVELIMDGRHIHPRMVDLACRCKPAHQLVGISDSTMAAGMPDGKYRIGPSTISVKNGYSQNEQSLLAGTTTMLDSGWHSLMSGGHLTETQAAMAVSRNPAEALGLKDRGRLLPNCRADIAIFEQTTNRPLLTVIAGEIVYQAEE